MDSDGVDGDRQERERRNDEDAAVHADSGGEEPQDALNLRQARSIADQLGLDDSALWGLDELAEALAVFDLDFTSLNAAPELLLDFIRDKAVFLMTRESGAASVKIESARMRLTGALGGPAGMMALLTADSPLRVDAVVDGFTVNAGAIVALANFMAFAKPPVAAD